MEGPIERVLPRASAPPVGDRDARDRRRRRSRDTEPSTEKPARPEPVIPVGHATEIEPGSRIDFTA